MPLQFKWIWHWTSNYIIFYTTVQEPHWMSYCKTNKSVSMLSWQPQGVETISPTNGMLLGPNLSRWKRYEIWDRRKKTNPSTKPAGPCFKGTSVKSPPNAQKPVMKINGFCWPLINDSGAEWWTKTLLPILSLSLCPSLSGLCSHHKLRLPRWMSLLHVTDFMRGHMSASI